MRTWEHSKRFAIQLLIRKGENFQWGDLEVSSDPPVVGLLINSFLPVAKMPYQEYMLPIGTYRVTARRDGFYEQVKIAEVTTDDLSKLHFQLKPIAYAHLTVDTNSPGAMVRIIGVEQQYHPGMKLAPGGYLLYLWHPPIRTAQIVRAFGRPPKTNPGG